MKKLTDLILPIIVIIFFTCLIFFKVAKGFYPVPGDLLVSFYFPWYSGGWDGYSPWTTHKEMLGADSIRQIYLWKEFAASEFKKGEIPLWNPYTFSGQPHLANFQSSVFYPLNIFYFLTDAKNAWIILIVLQPLLGGLFMYLAAKSFKLSNIASYFAAVSFMFSSYLITWMENGNISHSYIWLPIAFFSINKFFESRKIMFLIVLAISLAMSILAGHPQTAIYIYIATVIYFTYKISETRTDFTKIIYLAISILFSFALSAVQLIPTLVFYRESPISLPFSKDVFINAILPYKNLITFFASDFFGHPANNNFWSQSYGDFTPYFGVVPLVFSLWGIYIFWNKKFTKFAAIFAVFFVLASVRGPITYLIQALKIPLLDSTTPSRFISLSIFMMIILAAIGFEDFTKRFSEKKYFKRFLLFVIPILVIYVLFWAFTFVGQFLLTPKEVWEINLAVTRRNLILPTLMFASVPFALIFTKVFIKSNAVSKIILSITIFSTITVGGVYYTNKFLPVAPKKFIFPDHKVFDWLKSNAGLDRFYGQGTAHIDFNFPSHYQVYGAEGYDTLRLERYAELMASSATGEIPKSYLRSDAVFPVEENGKRKRLFDLMGIKYLLDKEDNARSGADWHFERFPNDRIEGVWQDGKFQIYRRVDVLPRVFSTTSYKVLQNDSQIVADIYNPDFDLKTLLLEKNPSLQIKDKGELLIPQVIEYQPNRATFSSDLNYDSLLFISDAYSKDWSAEIDDQKTPILRADYAFRAVEVPSGKHNVSFFYSPKYFKLGLYVTLLSLVFLPLFFLLPSKLKRVG